MSERHKVDHRVLASGQAMKVVKQKNERTRFEKRALLLHAKRARYMTTEEEQEEEEGMVIVTPPESSIVPASGEGEEEERSCTRGSADLAHDALLAKALRDLKDVKHSSKSLGGLRTVRRLLCASCPPVQAVLDAGSLPYLISFLRSSDEVFVHESLWCLTNVSNSKHEHTEQALQAAPELLQILASDNASLQEQAAWVIGNIAGDSDEFRNILLANGVLKAILNFLFTSSSAPGVVSSAPPVSSSTQRTTSHRAATAAWAISNLARGSSFASALLASNATPFLIQLMVQSQNAAVCVELLWLFFFSTTTRENDHVACFIRMGIVEALLAVACSATTEPSMCIPIVRCFGNFTSGPIEWIDVLLAQASFFPLLLQWTASENHTLKKESTWVVGNVLGGSEAQRTSAISAGLVDNVLVVLEADQFELQKIALFALRHACIEPQVLLRLLSFAGSELLTKKVVSLCRVNDGDVVLSSLQVLAALASASPTHRADVVALYASLGLPDVLLELSYSNFEEKVPRSAAALLQELFQQVRGGEEEEEGVASQFGSGGERSIFGAK